MSLDEASKQLTELIFMALDHGIDSVRPGGPLTPFVLFVRDGERNLQRYLADTLESSLAQAQTAVDAFDSSVEAYAIAHDGFLTVEGKRTDAIIVEAGERGRSSALIFCQRYLPKKALRKFSPVGNAAFVGEERNRLAAPA